MGICVLGLIILGMISAPVYGYPHFRDRIPNGYNVPNSCNTKEKWNGVGHKNPLGGGERNPFGLAFAANGYKWDAKLCRLDSDGDGRTNGQELGDPNCSWTPGATASTKDLSHPGVCEPLTAPQCQAKNNWEFCESRAFQCDEIKKPDVKRMDFRLPRTKVPPVTTVHYCVMVDLPSDRDYHVIADVPHTDNVNVMHHSMLYACEESAEAKELEKKFRTPAECGMPDIYTACRTTIAGWSLGMTGNCRGGNYGYRIGKTTYKKALMELHWTNPEKKSDYTDASGLTIYYTPKLRQYDAGVLKLGPLNLVIPPGQAKMEQTGVCRPHCTKRFSGPIFITGAGFHMHLLGTGGALEHYRNGQKLRDLAYDENWKYDSPKDYWWQVPVEVKQGDELRMTCFFKSTGRTKTTNYGKSTFDEMCFANIEYYPKQKEEYCEDLDGVDLCDIRQNSQCDMNAFFDVQADPILNQMANACYKNTCDTTCRAAYNEAIKHPCLAGDMLTLMLRLFAQYGMNEEAGWFKLCKTSTTISGPSLIPA